MRPDRPPRRLPAGVGALFAWESQAPQYERDDIVPRPGIVHWTVPEDERPAGTPVECLLYYGEFLGLLGILNYYPEGSPLGDAPHDFFLVVHPDRRRQGVGSALIREACRRWPQIDLLGQAYTDAGWATALSVLERGSEP